MNRTWLNGRLARTLLKETSTRSERWEGFGVQLKLMHNRYMSRFPVQDIVAAADAVVAAVNEQDLAQWRALNNPCETD